MLDKVNKMIVSAVLGDIAHKYNSASLVLINKRLEDVGYSELSLKELNKYLDMLKDKSSKEYQTYYAVKSGKYTLSSYLDDTQLPPLLLFTDSSGLECEISLDNLDTFIFLKNEYEKAYSGNIAWSKLKKRCASIGIEIDNTESFNKLVEWREKELIEVPINTQDVGKLNQDLNSTFELELGKLNIKKRDVQNITRNSNKLARDITDSYLFRKQLLDAIPSNIKLPKINPYTPSSKGEALIVTLGDIHVGLKTKSYNLDILEKRLSYYVSSIEKYVNSNDVDEIIVVGLGDFIEGAYLHATQLYEIEFGVGEQISKALSLVLWFLSQIRQLGKKTSFCGLAGNHDRLNESNKKDNILGDSVADVINATVISNKDSLDVNFIEPDTKIRHLLSINGKNIALIHGDIDKIQDKNVLSKLSTFFGDRVDAVIAGHLHSFWLEYTGYNQFLLQNSSAFDGNSYSDGLGVKNTPGQAFVSIDKVGIMTPHFVPFSN